MPAPRFSSRVPADLAGNRLARTLERLRTGGREIVDLTESNPTRAGFQYPPDLLAPLADSRGLVYTPHPFGSIAARQAVASEYGRRSIEIDPTRIVLTSSSSEAYSLLFKLLADPGDEVLVPRPSYPLFDHLTALDAVVARPYDLEYHSRWEIDFGSLDRALTDRTRAVLLVNPNNPTGSFVRAAEFERIVGLCARRGVAIIADEVFAEYEIERDASAAADTGVRTPDALTFALGGLSKSIGLPQVKLGWIAAAGPDALVRAALERLELVCDTYLSVSTPVQIGVAQLLSRGRTVREQIQARIVANFAGLAAAIESAPACRLLRAEGGWYGVVQVPSFQSEEDLVVDLLENAGVLVHPGYFFDFPRESYLIVSLIVRPDAFDDGIRRMLRHFDCTAGDRAIGPTRR
jgi:aspartate/methionine/tyrosine aminotransferase